MKPLRHPLAPGPGHRTPQTLLLLDERDKLLIEATQFYPGLSDRETARLLRAALVQYRNGRWRRDRAELTCPPQYRSKLASIFYLILRTRDLVPSEATIRATLSRRDALAIR